MSRPQKQSTESFTSGEADTTDTLSKFPSIEVMSRQEPKLSDPYLRGWRLAALTLGLALTIFMVSLDATIIATAVPAITSTFQSLEQAGWYGSAYQLATTVLQPSCGRLYTHFDVKLTFLTTLVIFEIGSVICATAPTSAILIAGRAIAGASASAIFAGGMLMIERTVPLRRRPLFIAGISSTMGISAILGPTLGGILTDHLSWRWCFWINLPLGTVTIVLVAIFFQHSAHLIGDLGPLQKIARIDLPSTILLCGGLSGVLLGLQYGGSAYPWHDVRVWACFLGSALSFIAFILVQIYRGESGLIPHEVMTQRTVMTCSCFTFLFAVVMYAHAFYLPVYFQAVRDMSVQLSGVTSTAYLLTSTIVTLIVGAAITITGTYVPFMWFGSLVITIGAASLHTLTPKSTKIQYLGYQILAGIGFGSAVQIPFIAVQVVLGPQTVPIGISIIFFYSSMGGAISLAAMQSIFINTLIREIPQQTKGLNATDIINAGIAAWKTGAPPNQIVGIIQSYGTAIERAFILPIVAGVAAFVTSLFVERRNIKHEKPIQSDSVS